MLGRRSADLRRTYARPPGRGPTPVPSTVHVALLTGGGDKPYALGLAAALTSHDISLDFIGSDELSVQELLTNSRISFLNLRGDQRPEASLLAKVLRILSYYVKLILVRSDRKTKALSYLVE